MVLGSGFRFKGLGFRVLGSRFRGFRVRFQDLTFSLWGSGSIFSGFVFRILVFIDFMIFGVFVCRI